MGGVVLPTKATMEDANITNEELFYGNLINTQDTKPGWFDDPMFPSSDKVSKVINEGSSTFKTGPNMILKVMSVDSYSVRVAGGWKSNGSVDDGDLSEVFNELLGNVTNSLSGASGGKTTSTTLNNNSNFTNNLSNFLDDQYVNADNSKPKVVFNMAFV